MSEVRTFNQNTIWANNATTTIPATPTQGVAYRNTDDSTHDDGYKYLSKAPSDLTNQVLFNLTSALTQLQVHGTLGWNSATAYVAGSICYGSDNNPYVAIQTSTNKDPISQPTYWTLMPPAAVTPASTFETVIQGIYVKWGKISQTGKGRDTIYSVLFSDLGLTPFPNACLHVFWQIGNTLGEKYSDSFVQGAVSTSTTLKYLYQGDDVPAGDTSFLAIGH
jgi:hypothetical protein